MKYYQSILISLLLIIFSCDSDEKNNEVDTFPVYETDPNIELNDTPQLIIEGKDIWIRDEPVTGDVLMKLNTGDICEVLEKGKKVQVRDMLDHWYKINFNDTVGWVFGSQTNLKTGETIDVTEFSTFLAEFIGAYKDNTNNLSDFTDEKIGNTVLTNPGVYCGAFSNRKERFFPGSIGKNDVFNNQPKGDFCEGYSGVKSGLYYWKIKSNALPEFVVDFDDLGGVIPGTVEIPEEYINNSFYKVQVISDEYHYLYLYFINIGVNWYLICEDGCDCSA